MMNDGVDHKKRERDERRKRMKRDVRGKERKGKTGEDQLLVAIAGVVLGENEVV